jgi:DNA-binding transcriptional LysR family regulator
MPAANLIGCVCNRVVLGHQPNRTFGGMIRGNRALTFGSYPLVLEAARQGLGIALAWRHLIEEDLS